jgi:hypothetical protein
MLSNPLPVPEGIRDLSEAIETAHVSMAESVLVKPRRLGMHTVGQVSPNPSQQVHIFSSMPAQSAEHIAGDRISSQLELGQLRVRFSQLAMVLHLADLRDCRL